MDNSDLNWFCYILGPELEEDIDWSQNAYKLLVSFCNNNNVSINTLLGRTRQKEYVAIRQVFCKWSKENTNLTDNQIGDLLNRDRVSVIHGIKTAYDRLQTKDPLFKAIYSRCMLAL